MATFSSEDADALSEAKDVAVQAIVEFVKAPDMFQVFHVPGLVILSEFADWK